MADKVYTYLSNFECVMTFIVSLAFVLFFSYILPFPFLPLIFLVAAVVVILFPVLGLNVTQIIIGKEGVTFNRNHKPIVLEKITDIQYRTVKDNWVVIRLTGTTPDGETVTRKISRGQVKRAKRDDFWEELKKVLPKGLKPGQ